MNLCQRPPFQKGVKRRRVKSEAEKLDALYLAWLRKQRSALGGGPPCDPAHVRQVELGAGTAKKPPFAAIPLTREQHRYAHQHGDRALLEREYGFKLTRDEARAAMRVMAAMHLDRWMKEAGLDQLPPH